MPRCRGKRYIHESLFMNEHHGWLFQFGSWCAGCDCAWRNCSELCGKSILILCYLDWIEWNAGSNIWAFNMRWKNKSNIQQNKIPCFFFRSPTSFAKFNVIFVLSKIEDEDSGYRGGHIVHEDSKHLGHYPITINLSLNTHNNNAVDCKETIQRPWLESSSCVVWRERASYNLLMARGLQSKPSDPTLNSEHSGDHKKLVS